MGDPQTVRELLEKQWPLVPHDLVVRDAWRDAWGRMKDTGILDYHIIPGAKCVVTPQGLEDGIAALVGCTREELAEDIVQESVDGCPPVRFGMKDADETFEAVGKAFRKALEAAGIEVVDEAVLSWDGGSVYERDTDRTVEFGRGDTIYVKRKED